MCRLFIRVPLISINITRPKISICVNSNTETVHELALEHFILSSHFVCIRLHNNKFLPVVWLWKPFNGHFVHFWRRWKTTASIINAFMTFLLISFSKILFLSFTLLYTFPRQECFAIWPKMECHTWEFAMLASRAVCALLIYQPFFSSCTPQHYSRNVSHVVDFQGWNVLYTFVESFQEQYKDGIVPSE